MDAISSAIGPSWQPDPSRRHAWRWWDGAQWSDAVSDSGVQSTDPLPSNVLYPVPVPSYGAGGPVGQPRLVAFPEAVRRGLRQYASFSGRATRAEYWWFALFVIGVVLGVLMMELLVAGQDAVAFVTGAVFVVLWIPSLAASVRRLHDTGRSGWWVLLSYVPFASIVVFVFHLMPSEPFENRWGPPPT